MGKKRKMALCWFWVKYSNSTPAHIRTGRRSCRRPPITIEVDKKPGSKNWFPIFSAIFLLPVFEKSVIINDFRAIAHSIRAQEGGNTVCCNAMVRNRTDDDSMTYWFPWKHPMARWRGLEFGVFDQTPPKTGSSARYGPRCSIFFPPQNYHSQSIGSALRASPFAALARKHNPNVGSRASQMHQTPIFCLYDVRTRSRTCCAWLRPRRV